MFSILRQFFNLSTYNVAEWIPFLRMVAVPFIFLTILWDVRIFTGLLYLAAFSSDAVDGFVARGYKMVTTRFAHLDSAGDTLMLLVGLYGFYYFETAFFMNHWLLLAGVVSFYLLQQLISLLRFGKATSFHTLSAKAAAVVQAIFITSMFIFGVIPWLFYLTIGMSILETIEETSLLLVLREWRYNVKGLYWVLRERRCPVNSK